MATQILRWVWKGAHTGGAVRGALLLASVATALGASWCKADYTVHVVDRPLTNLPIVAGKPLPEVCRPGNRLEVAACRGEYEPASFVIVAEQPLKAVKIEVDELMGPKGTLGADAMDVHIAWHWDAGGRIGDLRPTARKVLVKNDAMLQVKPMPTEDDPQRRVVVAPDGFRDSEQLQPVDIDDLKQFWITVHVPQDARAGSYAANLRIKPQNAPHAEITLKVEVYPFDLADPIMEYSVYYPTSLVQEGSPDWRSGRWTNTAWLTPTQYLLELQNMVAHGVINPNIFTGVTWDADGEIDFSKLEQVLALREQAGIGPGVRLYAMHHVGEPIAKKLSADEKAQRVRDVRKVMEWARERGYPDLYWSGMDEASGSLLVAERNCFQAVLDGGGKTWVACSPDFYNLVGDMLSLPVLLCDPSNVPIDRLQESLSYDHPRMLPLDDHEGRARVRARITAEFIPLVSKIPIDHVGYRAVIDSTHRRGNRIFAYAFPWSCWPVPETVRRKAGLSLWKLGFDGMMNWAYTHTRGTLGPGAIEQGGYGYVIRTENGVLNCLTWEAFREGVDDIRFLSTLINELGRLAGTYGSEPLVAETLTWLTAVDVTQDDLNATRREMARRIVALRELGGHVKPLVAIDPRKLAGAPADEVWDVHYDGAGLPTDEGWSGNANSMMFHTDLPPGFLLSVGNPGGSFRRPVTGYKADTGWTLEWAMQARNLHQLPAPVDLVRFSDDDHHVIVRFTNKTVIMKDHLPDSGKQLDLAPDEYHIFRLVKQPQSPTVELYIDNQPAPALAISPAQCVPPDCDANHLNQVAWGVSTFQARWDYFRYHKGATTPAGR